MTADSTTASIRPVGFTVRSGALTLAGDRWEATAARGTAVLLHGGGQTRHSWDTTAARLASGGWTALTYDLRGHGDSDWADDGDYRVIRGVGDLQAVLATLDRPPALIGASLGGLVALLAEGTQPQSALALVLVDIVVQVELAGRRRIRSFMTGHRDGFADLEEVADAVTAYSANRQRPRNLDGLRKNVRLRADGRWYWHWDPALMNIGDEPMMDAQTEEVRVAARRVGVPTLVVRGRQSDIVSDDGVRDMLDVMPSARFVEVEAGHMVAGDDNDIFTHEILQFLDDARREG